MGFPGVPSIRKAKLLNRANTLGPRLAIKWESSKEDVAGRKPTLTLCWKLFLWLAFIIIIILSGWSGGPCSPQSVQFSHSVVSGLFAAPWIAARQASLSITNSRSLLKLMSIESVMPSNHLIFCCPLLLLPSIFPNIRVFSNESALHIRWPKYWSFSISPSNEYSGLISFRMDWLDLLVVQGTLKSLLQHYSSKASILLCSAFFIVQLSHPYMTTGKTIALTRWTFVPAMTRQTCSLAWL